MIRNEAGNLCIDPVPPSDADLAEIAHIGTAKILLTNRNHSRAANIVRSRTGAETLIHPEDAAHARSQGAIIDGELRVGDRVGVLTVVAVPGKSPGEVALYWPERKLLIVGDAVIGNPPARCGLPAQLRRSVRGLLDLEFDALLFGDGTPIIEGAKARLMELVESFPN